MRGVQQPAWYAYEGQSPRKARRICRRPPCLFCTAWISFALLLSFMYQMSLPSFPKSTRFIDYQAFSMLASPQAQSDISSSNTSATTPTDLANSQTDTNTSFIPEGPSYPLDVYAPLVPNPVPLTEVTVMACFPLVLQKCKPLTTAEKDARLGPWVRVDRPLDPDTAQARSHESDGGVFGNLGSSGWFNKLIGSFEAKYLFYRRSRRSDVPRVVDLRLVEAGADNRPLGGDWAGWHRIKHDLKSSFFHISVTSASMHLYYRTVGGTAEDKIGGELLSSASTPESSDANLEPITELDVTYGPGPVWPGFTSIGMVSKANPTVSLAKVTLSARRKPPTLPPMPVTPLFKADGTFKILQLADLHLGVRHEPCREVQWESAAKPCVGDTDTVKMMERWLDEEKPDLVVFSGDQLNGQTTSWDEKSVIPKYITPLIERKIQWTSIMGNHDSQAGVLTRAEQQALLSRLPYSRTRVGPAILHDGDGAGNYYLKLHSPTPDRMHLFSLYFVDSGGLAPRESLNPFAKWKGYDWIRWDQIDWFLDISNKISKISRPYTPDGASDLPQLWNRTMIRRMGDKRQGTHLSKPKALFFTHIPVPEAFSTPDVDTEGHELSWGHMGEKSTVEGAQKKGGIFSAVIAQEKERDVIGFFHGHMHNNAGCRRTSGVWICFNGGSSFAGYGKFGMERRSRVIHISKWGEQVDTWHRMETTPGAVEPHQLYQETP